MLKTIFYTKKVGSETCKLALFEGNTVHCIFHVSRLKIALGTNANIVDLGVTHELKRTLGTHEKRTKHLAVNQ